MIKTGSCISVLSSSLSFALLSACSPDPVIIVTSATATETDSVPTTSTGPSVPTTSESNTDDTDGTTTKMTSETDTESSSTGDTEEFCVPGEQVSCYTGPQGTENVGNCQSGTKTCLADGSGFGSCEGEVLPQTQGEICLDPNVDDPDCDGFSGCSATGEWIHAFGELVKIEDMSAPGSSQIKDVATDSQGNVFYLGRFDDSLQIGSSKWISSTKEWDDAFVGKIDSKGTLLWQWQIVPSPNLINSDASPRSLAVDQEGNVFVLGAFGPTVKIGEETLQAEVQEKSLDGNMYVIKLDGATGKVLWFRTLDAVALGHPSTAITVDQKGDVVVAGRYSSAVFKELNLPGEAKLVIDAKSFFQDRNYLVKFRGNDGDFMWLKTHVGGPLSTHALAVNKNNELLLAVNFDKSFEFEGQQFAGNDDALIFTVDSETGVATWLQTYRDADPQNARMQYIESIAVDGSNNIIIGAHNGFNSKAIVVSQIGNLIIPGVNPTTESTVIKLSPQGQPLWYQHFSGVLGKEKSGVRLEDVAVESSNNIVLTGSFHDSMVVGQQSWNEVGTNIFIVKLHPLNNILWGKNYSTCNYCVGESIATGPGADIVVGGIFKGVFAVDGLKPVDTVEIDDFDAFVLKLNP